MQYYKVELPLFQLVYNHHFEDILYNEFCRFSEEATLICSRNRLHTPFTLNEINNVDINSVEIMECEYGCDKRVIRFEGLLCPDDYTLNITSTICLDKPKEYYDNNPIMKNKIDNVIKLVNDIVKFTYIRYWYMYEHCGLLELKRLVYKYYDSNAETFRNILNKLKNVGW